MNYILTFVTIILYNNKTHCKYNNMYEALIFRWSLWSQDKCWVTESEQIKDMLMINTGHLVETNESSLKYKCIFLVKNVVKSYD